MGETLLLTGLYTPLGTTLSGKLREEGTRVIAAARPGQEDASPEQEGLSLIPWNRSSPISAHNVILEAVKRFGTINRALILFDTTKDNRALHQLSLADIESYMDSRFKGTLFLLKELLHYYQRQDIAGEISLVLHSEGAKVLPPLDGMGAGGFRSLGNSLFTFYQNETIVINGFESSSSESEQYADFIIRTLQERGAKTHGKWFRFQEKGMWNALGNLGLTNKR